MRPTGGPWSSDDENVPITAANQKRLSHDGRFHTFYVTVWCSGSCLKTFQSEMQNLTTMECELHDKTTDPFNWPVVLSKNVTTDRPTNQPTNHRSERGNSFQHMTTTDKNHLSHFLRTNNAPKEVAISFRSESRGIPLEI